MKKEGHYNLPQCHPIPPGYGFNTTASPFPNTTVRTSSPRDTRTR